jgi:thymidylate synthase (FAD)
MTVSDPKEPAPRPAGAPLRAALPACVAPRLGTTTDAPGGRPQGRSRDGGGPSEAPVPPHAHVSRTPDLADRLLEAVPSPALATRRPVSPGAEAWLGVPVRVLDRGFVYLVDYLGNDAAIVEAARVSYGRGTRPVHEDRGLIRSLRRHAHTTPFEMVEVKLHVKLPIFVARQWIRHRTAHVNEYSARYSILDDEFYLPASDAIGAQSTTSRQGREAALPAGAQAEAARLITEVTANAYAVYRQLLELGVARELARLVLPVNVYTRWYWKSDLHNLLHFLRLRLDPHAQAEIRAYAEAIGGIIRDAFPLAWEAFEDYTLGQVPLTRLEIDVLRRAGVTLSRRTFNLYCDEVGLASRRERDEFARKVSILGVLAS